jgi:ubiquinone/menaquinone biosynthesis C-methylase UbiE
MTENAEERVSKFYNTVGWETAGGITEDARRWEDLRECAKDYVSKCRLRVLAHIPEGGDRILDMASGPIQYIEYLAYSRNFKQRYCVDLSSAALEQARKKIGEHGVFLNGSFLNIEMEPNFFDCTISLHTIYHIDKDRQEEAVRKLVDVTRPGKPVIIVYSNPNMFYSGLLGRARNIRQKFVKGERPADESSLYFYAHPIEWWRRYGDVADVKILPWRSLGSGAQKKLIPNNRCGKWMLEVLFKLEGRFPDLFVNYLQYPMIVLTKK